MKIQNPSTYNAENATSDFVFVIDSCENLQDFTDADCKGDNETIGMLNDVIVSTRIQTRFWNTKNFLRNGWEMNVQWRERDIQLNSDFFQRQQYTLIPTHIKFYNNWFINWPFLKSV